MALLPEPFHNEYGIAFGVLAIMVLANAIGVIVAKRLMHSLIYLLFTLLSVAGIFLILHAEFLVAMQMIVYTGGILVLLVFGILLTGKEYYPITEKKTLIAPVALFLAFVTLAITVFHNANLGDKTLFSDRPTVETMRSFAYFAFNDQAALPFVYGFIFLFMLLLGAFLGAVKLVKKEEIPQ